MLLQSIVMEDPGLPLKPIIPGGARGAMVPPNLTKGGRLCPPNNTGTHEFSDLPTTLLILPSPIFSFVCSFACGLFSCLRLHPCRQQQ